MKTAIRNLNNYIEANYPAARVIERKNLELEKIRQSALSNDANNCSLASMSRIFSYLLKSSTIEVYDEISRLAKDYRLLHEFGMFPDKIDDLANLYIKEKNLNIRCRGHYFGNFYSPLKREIDSNRPLMMNIGRGFYRDHSVSVCGYSIYNFKDLNIKIIHLIDGWVDEMSYFDYSKFKALHFPISSFNTFR